MQRSSENVYCSFFDSRMKRTSGARTEDREVEYYEIEIFSEESGVSHVNGREYPVRRGMLLCAKPGQLRFSELPVKCHYIRIHPGESDLDKILDTLPDVIYLDESRSYEAILAEMKRLSACMLAPVDDARNTLKINAIVYNIISICLKEAIGGGEAQKNDNRLVAEACSYIDENYTGDCTLSTIASQIHISPNYLHALFKRIKGITVYEYILRKRITHAKKQIISGEAPLIEIALSSGFCSQSHFNKVFKKCVGVTPARFRRELSEKY